MANDTRWNADSFPPFQLPVCSLGMGLARVGLQMATIPAGSAESERVFSWYDSLLLHLSYTPN